MADYSLDRLTARQRRYIQENSIERVLNSARYCAERRPHPDADVVGDLDDAAPIVRDLWAWVQNEIFKADLAK